LALLRARLRDLDDELGTVVRVVDEPCTGLLVGRVRKRRFLAGAALDLDVEALEPSDHLWNQGHTTFRGRRLLRNPDSHPGELCRNARATAGTSLPRLPACSTRSSSTA